MDEYFPGFYNFRQDDLASFQQNAWIVMDAYLLLDLFRISEGKKFIELLQKENIKKNLWLPYESVWLYHQLMHSVLMEQIGKVKSTLTYLTKFQESIKDQYTHPYVTDKLISKTNRLIKELRKNLNQESKNLADMLQNKDNSIVSSINGLYPNDKIGIEYDEASLQQLFDEAAKRYADETPPGYLCDNTCKNDRIKYHDYITWNEMQRYVRSDSGTKNIVFVTNRIRPDWFFIYDDKVISSRKELVNEFKKNTKHDICIISAHYFVEKNIDNIQHKEYEKLLSQFPETPVYGYAVQKAEDRQNHIGDELENMRC